MRICFLTSPGPHSDYLVRKVSEKHGPPLWIMEVRPRIQQIRSLFRRHTRIGWSGVVGTMLLRSYSRLFEPRQSGLRGLNPPPVQPIRVPSVNDPRVVEEVRRHQSDVVIVLGTSIIRKSVLAELPKYVINLHGGITPFYRGSNCAIWAYLNDDPEHVGFTWHLVDAGVDTGPILRQVRTTLQPDDTRMSIADRQASEAWPPLQDILSEYDRTGTLTPLPPPERAEGRLYYTPALWDYLRFKRKLGSLRMGESRRPESPVDHIAQGNK